MFLKRYKHLREFKPYFKKYNKLILVLFCVMIVASSMGMLLAYLMSEQLVGITNQLINVIVKFTILIVAGVLIHHICWFLWSKLAAVLNNRVSNDIKKDIISGILSSKYINIKNKNTGYFIERLNDDTEGVSSFYGNVAGTLVDVITNVSFLIAIYFLNWQCGLFFTIGIIFLFLIDSIKIKKDLKHLEIIKSLSEDSNSKLNESIRGIKDIKGFGIKQEVLNKNLTVNSQLAKQNIKRTNDFELLSKLRSFLQWLIDAVLVLMCAFWLFPTGQIEIVVLLIILNYKSLMYDTIDFFSRMKSYYEQGDYKAKRILEIIKPDEYEKFGNDAVNLQSCGVKVNNLSFAYNKNLILNNILFNIKENTATVFVGSSGSGKTTLFGLLTKLLDTPNNKVYFGDYDINNLSEESLKNTISIVNQDAFIFNDTVLNNIKIVKPTSTYEEIVSACKKANLHTEIMGFENEYNTVLTENGANLSGGQKQRIEIARVILKNTPIILFDEPTSALDKDNQSMFFNVIKELKTTKTILVIAHKLNNYNDFDNVFTLKNGNITVEK